MPAITSALSALREYILAQRALVAAAPEQKMLQGVYRGYAGNSPAAAAEGEVFAANQKQLADYYAARRAAQTGEDPHVEMMLIDPNLGYQYRIHPPGAAEMSRVRKLPPEAAQYTTQLYARGGLAQMKACTCQR